MKARRIEEMLEVMQKADPNGAWKGAPLTSDVITAMFNTLLNWDKDSPNGFPGQMAEELTDMWDEVYTKLWDEKPITSVEWAIFLHQAGDVSYTTLGDEMYIVLGNKECKLTIVKEYSEHRVSAEAIDHVLETAKVLMELSELIYEDDNLNDHIAELQGFAKSVDEVAADLWELSERLKSK